MVQDLSILEVHRNGIVTKFPYRYKFSYEVGPDPEKQQKFTQSNVDIYFLHKPFSAFYKGNRRQNGTIYTEYKKFTQTCFAGFRVFQV